MKLTDRKIFILSALISAGGSLRGELIAHRDRSLASRLQADGLVLWERTDHRAYKNLDNWTLHITPAGRAAINTKGEE